MTRRQRVPSRVTRGQRTVLYQNAKTFFDEQIGVEDDEAKGQRQDVVAGADLEEIANSSLARNQSALVSASRGKDMYQALPLFFVEGAFRSGRGGGHGGPAAVGGLEAQVGRGGHKARAAQVCRWLTTGAGL